MLPFLMTENYILIDYEELTNNMHCLSFIKANQMSEPLLVEGMQ
jgi:hypothetical protein